MLLAENGPLFWGKIAPDAGVEGVVFLRNQFFPDEMTFRVVRATCARLGETEAAFLRRFGRYFVREAERLNYAALFSLIGATMREFLLNLPNFHSRIALMFPEQAPPSFTCSGLTDRSVLLRCSFCLPEAMPFLLGMLEGLADRFAVRLKIDKQPAPTEKSGFNSFLLEWENGNRE